MFLFLPPVAPAYAGADFFVSPNGSSGADGSPRAPWDIATALAHPASVKPGDRIWR